MGFFRKKEVRSQESTTTEITPTVDDILLKAILTGEQIDESKALSIPLWRRRFPLSPTL